MTMTESRLQVALQSTSDLLGGKSEAAAVFVDPREALVAVLKEKAITPSLPMIARLSQLALLLSTQKIVSFETFHTVNRSVRKVGLYIFWGNSSPFQRSGN